MFGKLKVWASGTEVTDSLPQKAQELLVYLLLHRRSHPREKLATVLWEHGTARRTKAYLRKALWQLRKTIEPDTDCADSILRADADWIHVAPEAALWADVIVFEDVFDEVRDSTGTDRSAARVQSLEKAAALYTGDLLENWYQEWCLMERERLRDMFLRLMDRLVRCCEQRGTYDTGIQHGLRLLRIDPARERTHRQLMRLRARAGNRTGALRQYERCAEVLDQELGVRPATATRRLRDQIRADAFPPGADASPDEGGQGASPRDSGASEAGTQPLSTGASRSPELSSLRDGLARLREIQSTLAAVRERFHRNVESAELRTRDGSA
jgi:DNA-binding SARP family transcriptional activator